MLLNKICYCLFYKEDISIWKDKGTYRQCEYILEDIKKYGSSLFNAIHKYVSPPSFFEDCDYEYGY